MSAALIQRVVRSCCRCSPSRRLSTTSPLDKIGFTPKSRSDIQSKRMRYPPMDTQQDKIKGDKARHAQRAASDRRGNTSNGALPPSMRQKFRLFTDESEEVLDSNRAEWIEIEAPEEEPEVDIFEGLNLERGKQGVFDIEDLITALRMENAVDICTIRIPPESGYAEYLVICGGTSGRHLTAIAEFVRKYYKKKKLPEDPWLTNSLGISKWNDSWIALDLGNIIVHFMDNWTRDKYDLESLWALGPQDDPLLNAPKEQILQTVEKFSKTIPAPEREPESQSRSAA